MAPWPDVLRERTFTACLTLPISRRNFWLWLPKRGIWNGGPEHSAIPKMTNTSVSQLLRASISTSRAYSNDLRDDNGIGFGPGVGSSPRRSTMAAPSHSRHRSAHSCGDARRGIAYSNFFTAPSTAATVLQPAFFDIFPFSHKPGSDKSPSIFI